MTYPEITSLRAAGLAEAAWIRVVPFLFVIAFWVIGGIVGAMKKAGKRAGTDSGSLLEELDRPVPWAPPAGESPPLPPAAKPKPKKKRKREAMAPPPLPLTATSQSSVAASSWTPNTSVPDGPTSLNGVAIRQWLTPDVLRAQYIVTELIAPPAALRRPDGEPEWK